MSRNLETGLPRTDAGVGPRRSHGRDPVLNGSLELIHPDPSVVVSPASQAGAEKFRVKSRWREAGYSPIGIVFDRAPGPAARLPFATWKISADWMESGTFMPPAAAYISERRLVRFAVGSEWLLDVTLDKGRQGVTKNLQPELPMVVRY